MKPCLRAHGLDLNHYLMTDIKSRGSCLTLIYTRTTNPGIIIIPLMIIGIGVGCIFQPTLVAMQAHSPKSQRAVIISNRNFFRCAGGACGLAVSAAVMQATLRAKLPPEYGYLASDTYAMPTSIAGLSASGMSSVLAAYMAASRAVLILQVPLIGICFVACVFIRDRGLEPVDEGEDVEEERSTREVMGAEPAPAPESYHQPGTGTEEKHDSREPRNC